MTVSTNRHFCDLPCHVHVHVGMKSNCRRFTLRNRTLNNFASLSTIALSHVCILWNLPRLIESTPLVWEIIGSQRILDCLHLQDQPQNENGLFKCTSQGNCNLFHLCLICCNALVLSLVMWIMKQRMKEGKENKCIRFCQKQVLVISCTFIDSQ